METPPRGMRIGFGRQTASGAHGSAVIPMVCPEKIPLFASKSESLSARAMVSVSLVSHQLRCPKVSKGERREAGIQWIQPPKAVSDRSFRQTTSGAHGSANRADCLPRGKPSGAPVGIHLPLLGLDAPTPARTVGLPPPRGQYFLSKRKKVPKKARGTATTGKSPLLPIFERGSSQCRAQFSRRTNSCYRARSCSLFSSFKKGKAFSLRCLSPLCFAAAWVGMERSPCRSGCDGAAWPILQGKRPKGFPKTRWPALRAARPVAERR